MDAPRVRLRQKQRSATSPRIGDNIIDARSLSHGWSIWILQWVVIWLGVAALLVIGARLWGQTVPSNGQIAYVTKSGISAQVHVIDVYTRTDHLITDLIDVDQIAWSPDKALAFTVRHGETSRIMVIDLQRHTLRQLTNSAGFATNPSWSPDGMWLAFQSNNASGADIFVADSIGDSLRRLSSDAAFDGDPSWSPDSKQLVFRSSRSGNSDLYVMDLDGNIVRQLTDSVAREEHPSWSPDGKYIAFASHNWDIYLLEVATGAIHQLTQSPARDRYPTWSPDSTHIAFESNRDGQVGIYAIDLATGHVAPIAKRNEGSYSPIWKP